MCRVLLKISRIKCWNWGMSATTTAMHVAKVKSRTVNKAGEERVYESVLLRRSYREGAKVKHMTLANLSALPESAIEVLKASLAGKALVVAGDGLEVTRSLPHGHVAAVAAQAKLLGLPAMLGPDSPARDLVLALVIARVCRPGSKLATTRWWQDTTLAEDFGVAQASTDEVYAAMDWLFERQESIEKKLARKYLGPDANPHRLALFDLSSSWVTGEHCELAARGYSRDGKKGLPQIEYGLLTDPDGRPIAIRVVPGNTADPTAFEQIAIEMKTVFGVEDMVMVGDRGMITSARIKQLRELGGLGWVTALRSVQIAGLIADGSVQQTLFDEANLAEITHPDYPGERLIACRNPALADKRAHKRHELLTATETDLAVIQAAVTAGRLTDAGGSGCGSGKSSAATTWPNTSPSPSRTDSSPSAAIRRISPRKPPSTASTSSEPPSQRPAWTQQPSWAPTNRWRTWNATSVQSKASTLTCAPSTTGLQTGSARTCSFACSPPTSSGTSGKPGRH
jgi:hypothetical protein